MSDNPYDTREDWQMAAAALIYDGTDDLTWDEAAKHAKELADEIAGEEGEMVKDWPHPCSAIDNYLPELGVELPE